LQRKGIKVGWAAMAQEMKNQAEAEPGKLPESYTPTPEHPRKTLRDVMADCVSASRIPALGWLARPAEANCGFDPDSES